MAQLDASEQAAVHAARQRAVAGLFEGLVADEVDPRLADAAGLPAPQQALYLARQLASSLWHSQAA
jgi:hypothetical protein